MTNRRKSRILAMQLLYQLDIGEFNPEELLKKFKEEKKYLPEIIEFASLLFKGTVEHINQIDSIIINLSTNWNISRIAFIDRNILRFAIYEIIYIDNISKNITINEAIEIAKKYSTPESSKFVNGILDKVQKQSQTIDN